MNIVQAFDDPRHRRIFRLVYQFFTESSSLGPHDRDIACAKCARHLSGSRHLHEP